MSYNPRDRLWQPEYSWRSTTVYTADISPNRHCVMMSIVFWRRTFLFVFRQTVRPSQWQHVKRRVILSFFIISNLSYITDRRDSRQLNYPQIHEYGASTCCDMSRRHYVAPLHDVHCSLTATFSFISWAVSRITMTRMCRSRRRKSRHLSLAKRTDNTLVRHSRLTQPELN